MLGGPLNLMSWLSKKSELLAATAASVGLSEAPHWLWRFISIANNVKFIQPRTKMTTFEDDEADLSANNDDDENEDIRILSTASTCVWLIVPSKA